MRLTTRRWLFTGLAVVGIASVAIAWQAAGKTNKANSLPPVASVSAISAMPAPVMGQQAQVPNPYYIHDDIQYFPVRQNSRLSRAMAVLKAYLSDLVDL